MPIHFYCIVVSYLFYIRSWIKLIFCTWFLFVYSFSYSFFFFPAFTLIFDQKAKPIISSKKKSRIRLSDFLIWSLYLQEGKPCFWFQKSERERNLVYTKFERWTSTTICTVSPNKFRYGFSFNSALWEFFRKSSLSALPFL